MSDAFLLATVTNSIAALGASISLTNGAGSAATLTIQDIDEMTTDAISQEQCPLMRPRVDNFVTLDSGQFMTRDTYGADAAVKSFRYTLNYVFYFCPVGQGNSVLGQYYAMVVAMVATVLYFATHTALTGGHEVMPRLVNFGPVTDIQGTKFHGGEIAFDVMQFAEAS
jgi:hypothetical protein